MSKVFCKVSFLCIAMVLIVPCLYALTVLPLTDEQISKKAEIIVIGRVLSAYYEVDSVDKHPYTHIHVRVDEYLKGNSHSRDLMLKTLGGLGSKMGMHIPGAANFYRNEEVLLFLERRNDGSLFPLGLFLGKYSIYRDHETGRKVVVRHEDGLGKYSSEPRETAIRDLRPEQKVFFEEFRQKIRQFIQK